MQCTCHTYIVSEYMPCPLEMFTEYHQCLHCICVCSQALTTSICHTFSWEVSLSAQLWLPSSFLRPSIRTFQKHWTRCRNAEGRIKSPKATTISQCALFPWISHFLKHTVHPCIRLTCGVAIDKTAWENLLWRIMTVWGCYWVSAYRLALLFWEM